MKVVVDEYRCDAHGVCVDACPEVFALNDEDDTVTVLNEEPDESLRESLKRAEAACPKAAITIEG
jgi:ferredoxin